MRMRASRRDFIPQYFICYLFFDILHIYMKCNSIIKSWKCILILSIPSPLPKLFRNLIYMYARKRWLPLQMHQKCDNIVVNNVDGDRLHIAVRVHRSVSKIEINHEIASTSKSQSLQDFFFKSPITPGDY